MGYVLMVESTGFADALDECNDKEINQGFVLSNWVNIIYCDEEVVLGEKYRVQFGKIHVK